MSKKEKILAAATELFAHQGFKETATSEIAKKAGVAQGTVFHHFQSKDNLLIAICDELVQDYVAGVREAAAGPGTGWEALERVLKFSQEHRKKRYDALVVALRETRTLDKEDEELNKHFCGLMGQIVEIKAECIQRGIADGSIREVPAHITSLLIHILLSGIIHVQTQGLLTLPDLDSEVVQFCRRSLSTADIRSEDQIHPSGGSQHG